MRLRCRPCSLLSDSVHLNADNHLRSQFLSYHSQCELFIADPLLTETHSGYQRQVWRRLLGKLGFDIIEWPVKQVEAIVRQVELGFTFQRIQIAKVFKHLDRLIVSPVFAFRVGIVSPANVHVEKHDTVSASGQQSRGRSAINLGAPIACIEVLVDVGSSDDVVDTAVDREFGQSRLELVNGQVVKQVEEVSHGQKVQTSLLMPGARVEPHSTATRQARRHPR